MGAVKMETVARTEVVETEEVEAVHFVDQLEPVVRMEAFQIDPEVFFQAEFVEEVLLPQLVEVQPEVVVEPVEVEAQVAEVVERRSQRLA
jgi:hypothetical protein